MKQQIKAFTLIEIIVVLIISGLVIFGIADLYLSISKQIVGLKQNNRKNTEILMFYSDFKDKFEKANSVLHDKNTFIFNLQANKCIYYIFEDDFVVRKSTRSDTFRFKIKDINYKFQNNNLELINQINFIIYTKNMNLPVSVRKKYIIID